MLSRCDAMCPGRWLTGQSAINCGVCVAPATIAPTVVPCSHVLDAASTTSVRRTRESSDAVVRAAPAPLMSLCLPPSSHFFRPTIVDRCRVSRLPPIQLWQTSARETPLSIMDTSNFLGNLRECIIQASKWTTSRTPLEMIALAGREFPSLPASVRSAIVTASLQIKGEEDRVKEMKRQELENNHQAFVREFNAWAINNSDTPMSVSNDLSKITYPS